MPKQKSLYIYDPKVIYAHELYTFEVTKNKKFQQVHEPKPVNPSPISSVILDYSRVIYVLTY